MATTVQQIVDQAYPHSTANDPGATALDAELVAVVDTIVQEVYMLAHDANPTFFSKQATVSIDATPANGWATPTDAIDVLTARAGAPGGNGVLTENDEITVVPFNELDKEFPPRIYRVGRFYHSAGATGDPAQVASGDTLKLFYSHSHTPITTIGQSLDTEWPDRHRRLLILRLAHYLSLKDKARGDMTALDNMIDRATRLFMSDVESTESALATRYQRTVGASVQRAQPTN